MSTARKILSNTAFQIFGKGVTAALSIIVVKLLTSYLGKEGYGQYTTVYEFLAFFGIIADLGLYTIAVREMSKDEEKIPYIIGNVLGMRTLLVVVTMSLAAIAAFMIPKYQGSVIPLGVAIAGAGTILISINGTISSVLQVHLKMQFATIGLIVGKIVSVSYMAFAALVMFKGDIKTGFYHLMLAGVIGNLITLLITYKYTTQYAPIKYRFDMSFWREVLLRALPYGVALFLNTIYFRVDTILMSLLLPNEITEIVNGEEKLKCMQELCANGQVGLYGVAMRMTEVMLLIPIYFMNSVLPVLTRYLREKSEKLQMLLQYTFDFIVTMALPILVGGYILAYPIIFIISKPEFMSDLSKNFYGSDIALKLLLFALVFAFINAMFGILLVAVNQQMKLLYINGVCVLFNVITNIIFIPIYGFRGAALTSIACEFFILVATYITINKYLPLNLRLNRAFRLLISVTVMGLVIYYLRQPTYDLMENKNVALLVPIGGVVYFAMLFVTKAVDKEMIDLVRRR